MWRLYIHTRYKEPKRLWNKINVNKWRKSNSNATCSACMYAISLYTWTRCVICAQSSLTNEKYTAIASHSDVCVCVCVRSDTRDSFVQRHHHQHIDMIKQPLYDSSRIYRSLLPLTYWKLKLPLLWQRSISRETKNSWLLNDWYFRMLQT